MLTNRLPSAGKSSNDELCKDADVVREALAEVRQTKHIEPDETVMNDLTNPRVWYQHADSVRHFMHKLSDVNKDEVQTDEEQNAIFVNGRKQLLAHKLHSKPLPPIRRTKTSNPAATESSPVHDDEEMHLQSLGAILNYTHSDFVRVPGRNDEREEQHSEMKVVITGKKFYERRYGTSEMRTGRPRSNGCLTTQASLGNDVALTSSVLSHPDLHGSPRRPSISADKANERRRVRLPVLGKRLGQEKGKDVYTKPLRANMKRMVMGLYGECFDPSEAGHYTYKKTKSSSLRDESPVRCVEPGFDEKSPPPTSRTLSMFQAKSAAHGQISPACIHKTKKTRQAIHVQRQDEIVVENDLALLPSVSSRVSTTAEDNFAMYNQRVLYHQQVATENTLLLEKDFLYHKFPELANPAELGIWASNDTQEQVDGSYSPEPKNLITASPDDDMTILSYREEMELKRKQDRAIERRRRLEEIKQKQKARNPHLEVVPPKPLNDAYNLQEIKNRIQGPELLLHEKIAMETKVYKIFGERATTRQTQKKISDQTKVNSEKQKVLAKMEVVDSHEVAEVC